MIHECRVQDAGRRIQNRLLPFASCILHSAFCIPTALFLILALSGCGSSGSSAIDKSFAQLGAHQVAVAASDCSEPTDFGFSPDGQRVIYAGSLAGSDSGRVGVWINDSLLMEVDSVSELGFTEAGEPYYIASDSGKAFIYYRYVRFRAYERITNPGFSPDGKRFACLAYNGGRQSLIVSNSSILTLGNVSTYALDPATDRLAYAAQDSSQQIVVEEGDSSKVYDEAQDLTYSREGSHLAFAASAGGRWLVVRDGEELPAYPDDVLDISGITFNRNGVHLAYVVSVLDSIDDSVSEYTVVDENAGEVHGAIADLCYSPDGKNFAYSADDGDGPQVVSGQDVGPAYDDVWALTYAPDGSRLAYGARNGGQEFAVVNGAEHSPHDAVDKVVFSRNGQRIGYGALDGRQFAWVVENAR
jgi:Tol biopolymer transport system component